MIPVLTAAETQALDRATEARGVPVERLMERAGAAVAQAAAGVAGGAYGRRVLVVCGKGNNGGDGLVAARYLARRGARPEVVLLAEPSDLRPPASTNLDRLVAAGIPVRAFAPDAVARELERSHVAIDAIFGTGFRGAAEGPHRSAIELLNASPVPVLAVDVPSGVEGDTGAVRGPAVIAHTTVTFGAPKVGAVLFPGARHAGALEVVDIGFPQDLLRSDLLLVEDADVRRVLPTRPPDAHKRRDGVVLVVAGSRRMTGAPRLVAEGAYRSGAGLVTVAAPAGAVPIVQQGGAEATFLPLPQGPEGSVGGAAWEELEPRLDAFDAVAVGPGLSTEGETPTFVRRLVRGSPVPVVADADALNAFAGRAGELAERSAPLVVTPHDGELSRLLGVSVADIAEDRLGLVRKAAAETGAVVLLKGPRTLIATPEETAVRVVASGTAALATGGTGDVLTGAIAALVARGVAPADASAAAAHVHGVAGHIAARAAGDGTVASDVARALPEAVRRIAGA